MESKGKCGECGRPFGKRARCYHCTGGRTRTGEHLACLRCGKMHYVQANQINKGAGRYCSYECKYNDDRGKERIVDSKYLTKDGYVVVKTGIRQHKTEHRLVVEAALGRKLAKNEFVHHLNGEKQDNRLENLQVLTNAEHRRLYCASQSQQVTLVCQLCGIEYKDKPSRVNQRRHCSNKCKGKYLGNLARERHARTRPQRIGQKKRIGQYIMVYQPTHPYAMPTNGYVMEHRLIAEEKYGRIVEPDEHVHHINGIKDDNRPENLLILPASEHTRVTNIESKAKRRKNKAELEAYRRKFGPLEE